MSKLYIVGNGFDIHHGLKTDFIDFKEYLEIHNRDLLDTLHSYYPIGEHGLWSSFEENLANIDKNGLLDDLTDYLPDISSDDFKDRDWHAFSIEVSRLVGQLTGGLCSEFNRFILKASSVGIDGNRLVNIEKDAKYISFNYTKTLESQYGVDEGNIWYIHGIAGNERDIILGHSIDPNLFLEETSMPTPPEHLSAEYQDLWYEEMSAQYDPSYEDGVSEVAEYFKESFKNTKEIIEGNLERFSQIANIKDVYVLGHSMSEVDLPYFDKIANSVDSNCRWIVSFWDDEGRCKILAALEHLNVPEERFKLIKLTDLQ